MIGESVVLVFMQSIFNQVSSNINQDLIFETKFLTVKSTTLPTLQYWTSQ